MAKIVLAVQILVAASVLIGMWGDLIECLKSRN